MNAKNLDSLSQLEICVQGLKYHMGREVLLGRPLNNQEGMVIVVPVQ